MTTTESAIPDDVKTNAIADATSAAGSLLNSLVTTDEHGQVAALINFTSYDWTLVDGFGRPDGSANSDPEWEKAATGFSPYNTPPLDRDDGHMHSTNYTTFALGGRVGSGSTEYGGSF